MNIIKISGNGAAIKGPSWHSSAFMTTHSLQGTLTDEGILRPQPAAELEK
jgi:hypothetical protein